VERIRVGRGRLCGGRPPWDAGPRLKRVHNMHADILSWSRPQELFLVLALEGATLRQMGSGIVTCSIAFGGVSFVRFEMKALEHVMNNRRQHHASQHEKHDTGQQRV
jgi:hypothetical protein